MSEFTAKAMVVGVLALCGLGTVYAMNKGVSTTRNYYESETNRTITEKCAHYHKKSRRALCVNRLRAEFDSNKLAQVDYK